ncbi:MAG TPA: TOBE domain-containing protein [Candidatus Acidoferrales bacterium]|nr:TOBE domain-containing protein [Candidatus Acidoferrales bacterium]
MPRGTVGHPGWFPTEPSQWLDTPLTIRYYLQMTLSARNHLVGKVVELQIGDVMAHVVVKVGDNLVESVITRRSAEEMALKVGDTVAAVIKSTEVMLQKS